MLVTCRAFVSYAQRDARPATRLLELLGLHFAAAKFSGVETWDFHQLLVGERWHERIQAEIARAAFGLLLVSPAFLASTYIRAHELPHFAGAGPSAKAVVPVGLVPVDFTRHDLRGLEAHQIFRLGPEQRCFSELRGARREAFALELFRQIDARLALAGAAAGVRP